MTVHDLEYNPEAPFLGKEGEAMLTLWKAGMEWFIKTTETVNSLPTPTPTPTPLPGSEPE